MVGGENSFLPLKINVSGVIPPIFASSLLLLPATAAGFLATNELPSWAQWLPLIVNNMTHGKPLFMVAYGLMIVFFCFFYTSVVFNPDETAENLRKYGGFLPGIRPGKRTAEYLDFVLTRLTVIGSLYIAFVACCPKCSQSGDGHRKPVLYRRHLDPDRRPTIRWPRSSRTGSATRSGMIKKARLGAKKK
jgi:preprotein translocase subunit SecY